MKLLARVEADSMTARWCRLVARGRRYELTTRPRLALGQLIAVSLPGCPAATDEAIGAWLAHAYHEAHVSVLRPSSFRPAVLADWLDAVNADAFAMAVRTFTADDIAAFARDSGGGLLAAIRGALDGDARVGALADRVRRFAAIVAGAGATTVLDELAGQHDVEHLLGLEHAVVRWIAGATTPCAAKLDALARTLPDEDVSAGISLRWFAWWWRVARACTRGELIAIVDAAVELVDEHCADGRRAPIAVEARREARRMADRMRGASHARMWSGEPPDDPTRFTTAPTTDADDAHYAAYAALCHAAHALAQAFGDQGVAGAHRAAMQTLAGLAMRRLRPAG